MRRRNTMAAAFGCALLVVLLSTTIFAAKLPTAPPVAQSELSVLITDLLKNFPDVQQDGTEQLRKQVIERLLGELDPSGESCPANDFKERKDQFPPIVVRLRDGIPTITQIALFSDAWLKDVQIDDMLLQVNGKDCAGATITAINSLLSGKAGEEVELKLLRAKRDRVVTVKLKREEAKKEAFIRNFGDKVIYVRFSHVNEKTVNEFLKYDMGDVSKLIGVILDFRGAAGGTLEEARRICGRFVKGGTIASLTTASGSKQKVDVVRSSQMIDARMIVLVDAGTGCAGEVAAGALQELRRAVVMGERTSGLGASYNTVTVAGGAKLRLPNFQVSTPSGKPLFRKGLNPDIPAEIGKVQTRRWKAFRHEVLALLKGVKPADLPDPDKKVVEKKEKEDKEDKEEDKDEKEDEHDDDDDSADKKGDEPVEKSLEEEVLANYPLLRQFDRPFVRALNLLVSMNIFFREYHAQ